MPETICAAIAANPILDGVTLSGGDPLLQPEAMAAFLRLVKERTGQNVWCYTGYTLEECLADPARRECLRWIDTLVDGRYVEEGLKAPVKRAGMMLPRVPCGRQPMTPCAPATPNMSR